jgi:hypothetical protein
MLNATTNTRIATQERGSLRSQGSRASGTLIGATQHETQQRMARRNGRSEGMELGSDSGGGGGETHRSRSGKGQRRAGAGGMCRSGAGRGPVETERAREGGH